MMMMMMMIGGLFAANKPQSGLVSGLQRALCPSSLACLHRRCLVRHVCELPAVSTDTVLEVLKTTYISFTEHLRTNSEVCTK